MNRINANFLRPFKLTKFIEMNPLEKAIASINLQAILLCLILLNVALVCTVEASSDYDALKPLDDDDSDDSKGHNYEFENGHIRTHIAFNREEYHYKLRLNKEYVKYKFFFDHFGKQENKPAVEFKMWQSADLRPCNQQIGLVQAEVEPLLDCQPIAKHLLDESNQPVEWMASRKHPGCESSATCSTLYVKRRTTLIKAKLNYKRVKKDKLDAHFYPLKPEIVKAQMRDTQIEMNFPNGLGFNAEDQLNYGFYFETNLTMGQYPITCAGKLFVSLNTSETFEHDFPDGFPRQDPFLAYAIGQMDNGFLLSLKDISCGKTSEVMKACNFQKFTTDSQFTLVKRSTFPYWTCKHLTSSEPISSFFNYTGLIRQTKHHDSDNSYNTTINIDSSSLLFKIANFKLQQLFVNDEVNESGHEEMFLVGPIISTSIMGRWDKNNYEKKLRLHLRSSTKPSPHFNPRVQSDPALEISFQDHENEESYNLNFKLKKNLLDDIFELISVNDLAKIDLEKLIDNFSNNERRQYAEHSGTLHPTQEPSYYRIEL